MQYLLKNVLKKCINPEKNWKLNLLYSWKDIIGDLHTKVKIEKIYDDMIVLNVLNSCWMQELHILSAVIIKTINQKLEHPHIKQVRFTCLRTKKTASKKSITPTACKKEVQLSMNDEKVLNKITNPELKEALKAFRIRCYKEESSS